MPTAHDIARWRLQSQRLVTPYAGSAATVVDHLLAVQAENPSQAAWAVGCRTEARDPADLAALLDSGAVIRTHVLRSTWHFVPARDVVWLLELTAPRIRPIAERQLADILGWRGVDVDRATAALLDVLGDQPDRTRPELAEALRERGVEAEGQAMTALLAHAEMGGLICSGRPRDGNHTYAVLAERVPDPVRREREEALGELALRYFTGHGPATVQDLSYWATLTVTDVRRGLAQVEDRLESFEHDGLTFWHAPGEAPRSPQEPAGHLLQILDETYRGYSESRMVLDVEGVVPTRRETSIGMALVDAQMVARMKRTVGRRVVFELSPYRAALRPGVLAALDGVAARGKQSLPVTRRRARVAARRRRHRSGPRTARRSSTPGSRRCPARR